MDRSAAESKTSARSRPERRTVTHTERERVVVGAVIVTVPARSHARAREGDALRVLRDVYAARGERDQAEGTYREALAIAADLGMRPLAAHCHLGLARLARRTGKREQAQEHLATATTMFSEMACTSG